jgi:hypothetical protein
MVHKFPHQGALGLSTSPGGTRVLLSACLLTVLLALSGCVGPQAYRVSSNNGELWIQTPYSYAEANGFVSLLYFPGDTEACPGTATVGDLTVRAGQAVRAGRSVVAVRFTVPYDTLRNDKALEDALTQWWGSEKTKTLRTCYRLDQASVARSLIAQRPKSEQELFKSQFIFAPNDPLTPARALLLRPGLRVCASDVASDDREKAAWVTAGTTCARVTRAPEGGAWFEPMFGRLQMSKAAHAYGQTYRIGSWAEIQRPSLAPHLWLLIYPVELPANYESDHPHLSKLPVLAGIAMSEGTRPGQLDAFLKAAQSNHGKAVSALCSSAQVVCYTFGERAILGASFLVFVNGAAIEVAVGTTVGDMAAAVAPDLSSPDLIAPPPGVDRAAGERVRTNLSRLRMQRVFDGLMASVDLSDAGEKAYNLRLQPGDRLSW